MPEETSLPLTSTPAALELHGLVKGYDEAGDHRLVLNGLDVTVRRGERVAILGPSGSGKSTLLNVISGIDLPDAGTVRIGGEDLTRMSERERTLLRRRRIGFVFQFFNLLPTLTVLENLLLPLELAGLVGKDEHGRAVGLLGAVGLADRADSFPDRLSGGEQQRVSIARALVHRPELVLADEPTGNLDEDTADGIADLLERLAIENEQTLVVVTHSRLLASRMQRVLQLSHGGLTEVVG